MPPRRNKKWISDLAAMLRRAGLRRKTARTIIEVGEGLRQRTVDTGREYAGLVDGHAGFRVGGIVGGTADMADVTPLLALMRTERPYVLLHTHPGNSSFSQADALLLCQYPNLMMLTVTGQNGDWYVLGHRPSAPIPIDDVVLDRFEAEFTTRATRYRALVQANELTVAKAVRLVTHEVWEAISPELGLWYNARQVE